MFIPADKFGNIPKSGQKAFSTASSRAKSKNQYFLSKEEFLQIWNRAAGKCELSGIAFSDSKEALPPNVSFVRQNIFPWQPSLDQISPNSGYQAENCQLICKVVNIGKNGYQKETFEKWVLAVAETLRKSPS